MKKWLLVGILVFSFIGFLDASFLTIQHLSGKIPPCNIGFINGCETVAKSKYSEILGIPVAILGMGYYLAIFVLTTIGWEREKNSILKVAAWGTFVGFIASIYFVSIQLFVLDALCLYCIISATTSTAIWILGMLLLRRLKDVSVDSN